MRDQNPVYDVAISFLYQDVDLAQAIYEELSKGLKVFFYPRNQEELAGDVYKRQAKKYYTWSANYYVGPENNNTNFGKRNLIDTTLLLTPSGKFNAYINYDYGQNRNATYSNSGVGTGTADLAHWQGFAGALHGQLTSKLTATARGEYYFSSDPAGVKAYIPTKLTEETITGDYLFLSLIHI